MEKETKNSFLKPTKEEQVVLVLEGKCPHNDDWVYIASYGDCTMYRCKLCGQNKTIEF
jgi:hypothetical protein